MMDNILIIDYGSQVTQLIARRIRAQHIYCEIVPFHHINAAMIANIKPKGIILSGSPASVHDDNAPHIDDAILSDHVPIFAICYGQQALCHYLGATVTTGHHREFGKSIITITQDCLLFDGIWAKGKEYQVWMSHGDCLNDLPQNFVKLAQSDGAPYAAIGDIERHIYGVQFHPEVVHTPDGEKILENFAKKICGCYGDWHMGSFKDYAIEKIRNQVGDTAHVVCGLSGGVDSAVAAKLIFDAIGQRLTCIFVDHGLMRTDEGDDVCRLFRDYFNIPLIRCDREALFLSALENIDDPEQKRKIIGKLFIDVFEYEALQLDNVAFLGQGTLYPDVIESVSVTGASSVTIKSHHNVGGLPERMNLKLIEPLRDLFKDEVRALGTTLGLPDNMIYRHPFPGPGLAIRIPGAVTKEKCDILRHADVIFLDEIRKNNLYDDIWQAFCVLLPVKSVGVMGDGRTYDYVCAMRAVTASDGMTAESFGFSHEFLTHTATRIVNEVKGISRVVYDCTSKPPATIEWE